MAGSSLRLLQCAVMNFAMSSLAFVISAFQTEVLEVLLGLVSVISETLPGAYLWGKRKTNQNVHMSQTFLFFRRQHLLFIDIICKEGSRKEQKDFLVMDKKKSFSGI